MPQYRQIWKVAILPIIDFTMIVVGAVLVYLIRYTWFDSGFDGDKRIFGADYLYFSVFYAIATVSVFAFLSLYSLRNRFKWWEIALKIIIGTLITTSFLINYLFFNEYNRSLFSNGIPVSRFILGIGGFVVIYGVLLGRFILNMIENIFGFINSSKEKIVILGSNSAYTPIRRRLLEKLRFSNFSGGVLEYKVLNESVLADLEKNIKAHNIKQIFLLDKNSYLPLELRLVNLCENYKVSFLFIPSISDIYNIYGTNQIYIEDQLFLELKYSKLDGWWVVVKRLFDIVFALSFIVIFSWVYILIAVLLLIQNDSPVFYLSERVGPNGKTFKVWKFARMKREFNVTSNNPEALKIEQELIQKNNIKKDDGPLYKVGNDPRNSRIGKILEKTSLDELPQFFNVLIGNMSVVGPRPHQPREVAKYHKEDYKVLNIKPGITGLAQINGRSDLSFAEEVKLDTYYIENWTFLLDISIAFKTPIVLIFKRHRS